MEKIKVGNYYLDKEQMEVATCSYRNVIVSAGAGSGKTLTILGRIYYLVEVLGVSPSSIICISFTRAASFSLRDKIKRELGLDINVFTFHKLALTILADSSYKDYSICDSNLLEEIVYVFFRDTVLEDVTMLRRLCYYFGISSRGAVRSSYLKFYNGHRKDILLLQNLVITFIHLFKCNDFSISDFSDFLKRIRSFSFRKYRCEKYFLIFVLNIYLIYQDYLVKNKEMDFDDMISLATEVVSKCDINIDCQYVIIDEYQDSSMVRFSLIKAILDKHSASLLVVGDDFQSIYRFTGCDLDLFLGFDRYFDDSVKLFLCNTYRNSQELINIASWFIMKNKKQIRKKLVSCKSIKKPLKVVYYKNFIQGFKFIIEMIHNEIGGSIMVLGRNNKDIFMITNDCDFKLGDNGRIVYLKNKDIDIYFMTVHKAKGLEEDNVIIINMNDEKLGFPNKIRDDRVLRLVNKSYDSFPFSEERRLFYVGITRCKNYVFLMCQVNRESVFVKEILKYKKGIEILYCN